MRPLPAPGQGRSAPVRASAPPAPAPAPPIAGVSVDTSGPDVRVDFELTRPAGKGSYLVGLLAGDGGRTSIRHLTVSLRDGRVTGLSTYDVGTVIRRASPRLRVLRQCTAAQGSPTPRRGPKHSEVSVPGRTGTGRRQGASGSKPVFSSAPSWSGTSPRWRLLHNGYPVVHLAENTDLDIRPLARSGLEIGAPDLRTDLPCAERLTPRP